MKIFHACQKIKIWVNITILWYTLSFAKSLNLRRGFWRRILELQLQNNPSSLHILTLYTIRTMTTSVYQKRTSKDSYYSLYVHMCLRNANTTRDMREEEHKVLNRIITYFDLYTFAASICRFFVTRYNFTQMFIIKLWWYSYFVKLLVQSYLRDIYSEILLTVCNCYNIFCIQYKLMKKIN